MKELENVDIRILNELGKNSKLSQVELAEAVGSSVTPCWRRVKKLEEDKVIEKYSAQFDIPKAVECKLFITRVVFDVHRKEAYEEFEKIVDEIPQIIDCYAVTGEFDYILKVLAPGFDSVRDLMIQLRDSNSHITKYFLHQVIDTPIKDNIDLMEIVKFYENQ